MRPLRLRLGGFTCFRDEQDIDFAGLELFAIAGPTGAGKTSLLDARSRRRAIRSAIAPSSRRAARSWPDITATRPARSATPAPSASAA